TSRPGGGASEVAAEGTWWVGAQAGPGPSRSAAWRKSWSWFSVVWRSEETRKYRASTGHLRAKPISNLTLNSARVPAVYLERAEVSFLAFLLFCRINNLRRLNRGE